MIDIDIPEDKKNTVAFCFRDFDTIRTCVNKELEKCKNTTPANIVDAFFKFLKKHIPCDSAEGRVEASLQTAGSWAAQSFSASGLLTVIFLLSLKMF